MAGRPQLTANVTELPCEVSVPTRWRQIALTLVVVGLLVATFNLVLAWGLRHTTPNRGYWLVKTKFQMLRGLEAPVDRLVLGDSTCNQGVRPEILEARLGGSTINLCTFGPNGLVDDALMLDAYVRKFGPPKSVIVVHAPDVWSRPINYYTLSQAPLGDGDLRWLGGNGLLGASARLKIFLGEYVPIYSAGKGAAELLRHPFNSASRRFELEPNGFMKVDPDPENTRSDIDRVVRGLNMYAKPLSGSNAVALEAMAALADKEGFDLVLFHSPVCDLLIERPETMREYTALNVKLNAQAAKSSHVFVGAEAAWTWPAEQMQNADHLTTTSSVAYTVKMAEALAKLDHSTP